MSVNNRKTHYIDINQSSILNHGYATCGSLVLLTAHSNTPTCEDCMKMLEEEQEQIRKLMEDDPREQIVGGRR